MRNKMFLCGNGFSINFDSGFGNIMDRLYEAHLELKRYGEYSINSSNSMFEAKAIENYNEIMGYIRNISKDKLYKIFEAGMEFGKCVHKHKELFDYCKGIKKITDLTFEVNEWTILESLIDDWDKKGLNAINIEYITILVHFYYALGEEKLKEYGLEHNEFVKVLRIGGRNKYVITEGDNDLGENFLNGFTTYYRLLFSIAIFNGGKAISLDGLDRIDSLDKEKLTKWLDSFKALSTLNYDHLLELLLPSREVLHLHGEFEMTDEKMFCNYQSLRSKFENSYVSFSDILIGDYIYNKTSRGMVNVLAYNGKTSLFNNKQVVHTFKLLEQVIRDNQIEEIEIFGMNINNDQHIIRNLITGLYWGEVSNAKIKYYYFNEEEKAIFEDNFEKCIVFAEEINDYVRKNIKLEYVPTQEVLEEHFSKVETLV